MSITYRSIDVKEAESEVLTSRALAAETEALTNEMEVLRLEAMEKKATAEDDKENLRLTAEALRDTAKASRNRAKRMNEERVLTEDDVVDNKRSILTQRISSLEHEHVSHSLAIAQRENALASTDETAPGEEEKTGLQSRLAESKAAIEVVEAMWSVLTAELDALPKPVVPEENFVPGPPAQVPEDGPRAGA